MSYYRPSQTVGMSRGSGRGYSSGRGSSSYRGGGGGGGRGGSSWNDRGGSRGSFSSSRGGNRFSSWSNSSFDSRTRYNTSSGSGDRYSSTPRGRPDDSSYRRSYRSDGPTYSSGREASTRSPDRKRLRIEAGSSRRSHEGGYGASDGYGGGSSGRYESAPNSYGSERRSAFNDDRRATFRQRDEGARLSPRTSFRGRTGPRSGRARPLALRDIAPRRRIIDNSTYIRKRGLSGDFFRRVRISRLRSANSRRSMKKGRSSEKDVSDKEEENWDDDVNDDDTGAAAAKKSKEDADSSKQSDDRKSSPEKKSPKKDKDKDKEDGSGAEGEDGGDTAADEDRDQDDKKSTASDDDNRARSKYTGRPFIPLTCPHCGYKCVRFREYSMHLYSGRHIMAMRKVSLKQKSLLARARQAQRSAQRELEKNDDALAPRTNFCPLCKLNYRQLKSKHQMSEAHRNMKKFLMPYCRVCHLTFKSPMLYENHLCSLDHIKKKAHEVSNGDKHGSDKEGDSPAEEELENFTTIDSVGDVDEEEGEPKKISKPSSESLESSSKPTEAINVGVEHVKKVEVYYCDLCRTYLSRHEEEERALRQHCRGRVHLRRYVRYKEDKDLRRQAERIHRKTQEAKEAKEKEKEQSQGKGDEKEKEDADTEKQEKDANDEDATDDKMWADVDKDLGEILAEVHNDQNGKSSDEEDDGGRYDRFRYSDKPDGKEDLDKTDPDVKEENEEKEEGEVNAEEEEEEEEEKNEEKAEEEEEK